MACPSTGGDLEGTARFIAPWAEPEIDKAFQSAKTEELYDEYLAETRTWDSEHQVYVDSYCGFDYWLARRRRDDGLLLYTLTGAVSQYHFLLTPNELANEFIALRKFLTPEALPPQKWPSPLGNAKDAAG